MTRAPAMSLYLTRNYHEGEKEIDTCFYFFLVIAVFFLPKIDDLRASNLPEYGVNLFYTFS